MKFQIIIFLIALISINKASQDVCRALCLEGGGDAGAYEAGALYQLVQKLAPEDVQFDVVTGVSTGSLGGLVVSSFPKGEEKKMVEAFKELYFTITQDDVFKHWNHWGKISEVHAFYDKPSLYNSEPLKETLSKTFQKFGGKVHRKFSIGVTDATDARKVVFDADKMSTEDIIEAAYSSASMPFFFQYQNYKQKNILVDGGVLHNLDISSAVRRCKEMGFAEDQIEIDVILSHGNFIKEMPYSDAYTGYDLLKRYLKITKYYKGMKDLIQGIMNFPKLKYRHIIMPLEDIGMTDIPLNFDQKLLRSMFNFGLTDVDKILADPSLISIEKLKQFIDQFENPEPIVATEFPRDGKKISNLRQEQ